MLGWNTYGGHRRGMCDYLVKEDAQQQQHHHGALSSVLVAAAAVITEEAQTAEEIAELFGMALKLRLKLLPQICTSGSSSWWQQRIPAMSVSGADATRQMISAGFVANQEDAVRLGNKLMLIGALCGTAGPSVFLPYDYFFYRFSVDRYALLADRTERKMLMDGTRFGGVMIGLSHYTMAELSLSMRDANTGVVSVADDAGVRSFRGKDVVDWLLSAGMAETREEAALIASALVREGVFSDVEEKLTFRDGMARYSFAKDRFGASLLAGVTSGQGKRKGLKGKRAHQPMTTDTILSSSLADVFDSIDETGCTHPIVRDTSISSQISLS